MSANKSAEVQTAKALHTPLKANPLNTAAGVAIFDTRGNIVASCFNGTPEITRQRAAFIVRAVNCHDELVAACKVALDSFGCVRPSDYAEASQREFDALTAALAKAEVQS